MKLWTYIVMFLALVGLSIFFFAYNSDFKQVAIPEVQPSAVGHVRLAGVTLTVDLAMTPAEHEQGLSDRPSLDRDHGMLFVFENPGKYPFWMKDMNFPIDMIWIGQDLKVNYIAANTPPSSYPNTFVSDKDAKYVLETVAGFSAENALKPGDSVTFADDVAAPAAALVPSAGSGQAAGD